MYIVEEILEYCTNYLLISGFYLGFFLVFLECFIPILPLSIFITLNINAFGFFLGVLISWISTCTGSILCYLFFQYVKNNFFEKFLSKKMICKIEKSIDKFSTITFTELVLLITLPFTPSFFVNMLCGLSDVSFEKFFLSLIIGKVFIVVFWGYIGKSLIFSLTDINSLIYIIIALLIAYIISKLVNYKMNIE